ncbi:MAG TPA: PAS domain-containing protein [Steroidobacteraceae bacterium]|jgi:PAS domain S-box-containing protein
MGNAALQIRHNQITGHLRRVAPFLLGGVALVLLTWMCFAFQFNLATTCFVYLIAIVLLSLVGDFTLSFVLSIIAFACLAYFFASPIFDFRVQESADLVLAIAFLLTSFIVTSLVRTSRQQTEAALQAEANSKEAGKELRLAVDTIPALIWTASADGSLDFVNQRWEDLGLSLADLRGSEWANVIHPDERNRVTDKWLKAVETGTPYENIERVRRADGEYRWFLSRARPLCDQSGKIIKWYGADSEIEEQRRAEDALRESEQRFRDYAETASDWLWETGPDHQFTRISDHVDKTGLARPNRIGFPRWRYATDVESEPEKWRLHRAMLDAHQPFRELVFATTRADGSTMYIQSSGKPFFDANGGFLGYRGVSADVTAEVRADQVEEALRKVQTELAHVTRVTTLGELTASIAHQVNQPLAAVVTNAEACLRWLDRGTPDLGEARQALEGIIKEGKRAGDVIRHVRALSNKSDAQKAPVDINDVVNEVIALVGPQLSSHLVSLDLNLAPVLPPVLADRVQLQQVVINLVMNGIEAMEAVTDRPRKLLVRSHQNDAQQVVVKVQDFGVGISAENVDQLFKAFFTTKSSGMGMGLSICRSIIEAHDGRISASGNVGLGSTFQFVLPAHRQAISAPPK